MRGKRVWIAVALGVALLSGLVFFGPISAGEKEEYTVIVRGAMIIDGTGAPGVIGDIAINGKNIALIAPHIQGRAAVEVNAAGLVVSPGFIDIHTHTDGTIFSTPLSDSKIRQGVTTEVTNNCGSGPFPLNPESKEKWRKVYISNGYNAEAYRSEWFNFRQYVEVVQNLGVGVNLVPLVPHGRLRASVMGLDDREPSEAEMARMEQLLDEALRDGAWGLSTGLEYVPGCFAKTDELVRLAKVVNRYDALYASHTRGEGLGAGTDEAIRIGRESGVRVQISHLKVPGAANWGQGPALLEQLAASRANGVSVFADQYPYQASSTSLAQKLPRWARAGGNAKMLERLALPELRERITQQTRRSIAASGGPDKIMVITKKSSRNNSALAGKWLSEVSEEWNCSPEGAVIRLLQEDNGNVDAMYFTMSEADVLSIVASPDVAVSSDSGGYRADAPGNTVVHPRSYGTFAKILGEMVRERHILSLEQAVYKMTGLPAIILGFADRGLLRNGYAADLVIFDPQTIADQSDYSNPHRYATGVSHVMVNGEWAVKDGDITGIRAGHILRKGK